MEHKLIIKEGMSFYIDELKCVLVKASKYSRTLSSNGKCRYFSAKYASKSLDKGWVTETGLIIYESRLQELFKDNRISGIKYIPVKRKKRIKLKFI